jgi:hypothetical protein
MLSSGRRRGADGNAMGAGELIPCCWLGCTHRKDKELSPSVRWVLGRRIKASA